MYFIIYKTTNVLTDEFYIGKHCTENLNDGYIGTGMTILKKIKQFGKQHFYRNILEFCNSYDELNEAEKRWLTEDVMNDPRCYNNQTGGDDEFVQSSTTREKISFSNKGKTLSEETKRKISDANKGRIVSEDTKQKLRLAWLYKSDEELQKHRERCSMTNKGKPSPKRGIKLTEEHKKHLSESLKGKHTWNTGKHYYTNGEVNIALKDGESVPNGFYLGMKPYGKRTPK